MRTKLDLTAEHRVRLSSEQALAELREDILRASYVEGDFVLSGGLRRGYYLDKYLFETRPAILRRLARFLAELVPRDTDRLAAPALGAVALGTAVSLELGIPLVIARISEEPGSPRSIEGELYAREEITLIEDVVVTGDRAMNAVTRVRGAEAEVSNVVSVLDREEGARQRFVDASIGYLPLFTPDTLGIRRLEHPFEPSEK